MTKAEIDEFKWLAIFLSCGMLCITISFVADSWAKRAAMENGYIQKIEDGRTLWVKEKE